MEIKLDAMGDDHVRNMSLVQTRVRRYLQQRDATPNLSRQGNWECIDHPSSPVSRNLDLSKDLIPPLQSSDSPAGPTVQSTPNVPEPGKIECIDLTKSYPSSPVSRNLDPPKDPIPSLQSSDSRPTVQSTPNVPELGKIECIDLTKSYPSSPVSRNFDLSKDSSSSIQSPKLPTGLSVGHQPEIHPDVLTGVMSLHTDDIVHVVIFLDRRDVRSLGITCKGIRRRLATYLLLKRGVLRYEDETVDYTEEFFFLTSHSFELLNPWWRYGGIFAPARRVSLRFPFYDPVIRNRCVHITTRFFRHLPSGTQHFQEVVIHVGLICERERFRLDESSWVDLIHSLHQSGCVSLSILSPDVDVNYIPPNFFLDKSLLDGWRGQISGLQRFTLDSPALTNKELCRWLLAQLSNGSRMEDLRYLALG